MWRCKGGYTECVLSSSGLQAKRWFGTKRTHLCQETTTRHSWLYQGKRKNSFKMHWIHFSEATVHTHSVSKRDISKRSNLKCRVPMFHDIHGCIKVKEKTHLKCIEYTFQRQLNLHIRFRNGIFQKGAIWNVGFQCSDHYRLYLKVICDKIESILCI